MPLHHMIDKTAQRTTSIYVPNLICILELYICMVTSWHSNTGWPKRTLSARWHMVFESKLHQSWMQTMYWLLVESFSRLLRCCFVSLSCAYCPKNSFKMMEIHSSFGLFPRFLVHTLEQVKKAEFHICFGTKHLNEKKRPVIFEAKVLQTT